MTFNIKESNFYLNKKKVFVNSGEIHYFRVRRELWDKHLEAAREARLNRRQHLRPLGMARIRGRRF